MNRRLTVLDIPLGIFDAARRVGRLGLILRCPGALHVGHVLRVRGLHPPTKSVTRTETKGLALIHLTYRRSPCQWQSLASEVGFQLEHRQCRCHRCREAVRPRGHLQEGIISTPFHHTHTQPPGFRWKVEYAPSLSSENVDKTSSGIPFPHFCLAAAQSRTKSRLEPWPLLTGSENFEADLPRCPGGKRATVTPARSEKSKMGGLMVCLTYGRRG